jgi:hypothetical protein
VASKPIWLVLRRGEIVEDFVSTESRQTALRLFGFVPVSPDGSSYRYDARRAEVNNEGYGSLRQPKLHSTLPEGSPVAQWLDRLRTVRVDLRFREDGVHTILTLDQKSAKNKISHLAISCET